MEHELKTALPAQVSSGSADLPQPKDLDLGGGSWLRYEPRWLDAAGARALFIDLEQALDWELRPIVVFGREVLQPRLIGWAGEVAYRYSGQELPPRVAPPPLTELQARVEAHTGARFNHVVANLYRDGQDHVSMHADAEPELGRCPLIASVSLGATRAFVFQRKRNRRRRTMKLHGGSLLEMGGGFQHQFRHAVPRSSRAVEPRLNLTFRYLHGPPGWRQRTGEVSEGERVAAARGVVLRPPR